MLNNKCWTDNAKQSCFKLLFESLLYAFHPRFKASVFSAGQPSAKSKAGTKSGRTGSQKDSPD